MVGETRCRNLCEAQPGRPLLISCPCRRCIVHGAALLVASMVPIPFSVLPAVATLLPPSAGTSLPLLPPGTAVAQVHARRQRILIAEGVMQADGCFGILCCLALPRLGRHPLHLVQLLVYTVPVDVVVLQAHPEWQPLVSAPLVRAGIPGALCNRLQQVDGTPVANAVVAEVDLAWGQGAMCHKFTDFRGADIADGVAVKLQLVYRNILPEQVGDQDLHAIIADLVSGEVHLCRHQVSVSTIRKSQLQLSVHPLAPLLHAIVVETLFFKL
mmetsp:Transcript_47644/g.111497  ORF Transcript_47644/g.111497 Transcript_47644/m.111497 type:complete len:270 (-) Transcript_47644:147-956(-)